jgi:hypothetical protein
MTPGWLRLGAPREGTLKVHQVARTEGSSRSSRGAKSQPHRPPPLSRAGGSRSVSTQRRPLDPQEAGPETPERTRYTFAQECNGPRVRKCARTTRVVTADLATANCDR